MQCWKLTFLAGDKYLLPGIKYTSKPTYLEANIVCYITHCQIYDKTQFHMVKNIINAFDHMELCFVLQTEEIFQ